MYIAIGSGLCYSVLHTASTCESVSMCLLLPPLGDRVLDDVESYIATLGPQCASNQVKLM